MTLVNHYKVRRLRARARVLFTPRSETVPARWLRHPGPLAGRKVVLFVTHAPDAAVTSNARYQIIAWRDAGFTVVTIIAADDPDVVPSGVEDGDHVLVRANRGYDFGAWAGAIARLPELKEAALLAIANDSVYGPTNGFPDMLARVAETDADVIGLTDSHELVHHIQSYLVFFKPRALNSRAFWRFWHSVRLGDRQFVIDLYETRLRGRLARAGLVTAVLYPGSPAFRGNATLVGWRDLLDRGFPFIKAQLVRDNPFDADIDGWAEHMNALGYDSRIALDDLARRRSGDRHRVEAR